MLKFTGGEYCYECWLVIMRLVSYPRFRLGDEQATETIITGNALIMGIAPEQCAIFSQKVVGAKQVPTREYRTNRSLL